jgi:penicillin amidase
MSAKLRRGLLAALATVLALGIILGALGLYTVRRSFPQTAGVLQLPGLQDRVEVLRDPYGVPHIYAANEHDLFMAQGFVHAQDRFWQMDFWRHIGAGRTAEMFGESQVETDKFLRTMGWARVAAQELEQIDPQTLSTMEAYAEGVNAYLQMRQGAALSLEYAILGLLNADYRPEPWTPLHSLTWAKVMAWDLGGNLSNEIWKATLMAKLPAERLAELSPPYPEDHPVIVSEITYAPGTQSREPSIYPALLAQALPALEELGAQIKAVNALTGGGGDEIGSNNWVISGQRTATGMPLLANDMHLDIQIPSIWYEIGLHCQPLGSACPINVAGFSFAGVPAVIVGHNDHIAWGVTNVGPDVQDLYLEKINPANPYQYEFNGQWVDMTVVDEVLEVAGSEPITLNIRYTRHGPILSDVDERMQALAERESDATGPLAISLRWTALDPGTIVFAVLGINRASNWADFRQALSYWDVPSQNFVFADTAGNIGYQTPGKIPIRAKGDGSVPVPGWTDEHEWLGYIPFEELPTTFNPQAGYVVTANNAVVGPDYPYLLSTDWDLGYRAARIVELIESTPSVSISDIQGIHGDDLNAMGPIFIPLLNSLEIDDESAAQALAILAGWDYHDDMDSAAAAIFNVFWHHLVLRTFSDELPSGWLPGGPQAFLVLTKLAAQPHNPWWDDQMTRNVESRDDILQQAFSDALEELQETLGEDTSRWAWGAIHTATFRNGSLGESGIKPIEALFNRGPFAVSGGSCEVNNTAWSFEGGYQAGTIPSQRMIVDMADFDNSLTIHTTGQSGHAYHPNYINMADAWRLIQYKPMRWSRASVEAAAVATLTLVP